MDLTRRSLIAGGTAALCWPRTLFAQKPARIARVVIANEVAEKGRASFRAEFAKHGWVDGRNLALSFVGIAGAPKEEAEARAREVIAGRPDAILIIASSAMALLRRLTKDIPVVFHNLAIDPAKIGLVESLPRPGGNFTGTSHNWELMMAKAWSMLKEIRPDMKRGGMVLTESESGDDFYEAFPETQAIDVQARNSAASRLGIEVRVVEVPSGAALDVVIKAIRGLKSEALIIGVNPALHEGVIEYLTKVRLPAFGDPVFVRKGGLGAMTLDFRENRNQAVTMVAGILRGASPATMPVYQGTRYGFLLNLRAARAMGFTVPASIRVQATEVIGE